MARCLALAGALATAVGAAAQSYMEEIQDQNASEYEAPWQEKAEVKFPPLPKADNLVPLDPQAIGSGYEYYVDTASLRLGGDQVLRYVVVLESNNGSRMTYYEGMRCETRQVKTYGYVARPGVFKPLAASPWKRLRTSGPYAYRHLLAEHYMCDREGWPITEKQVLERLAQNSPSGARLRNKPFDISN